VAELNFEDVPEDFRRASSLIERVNPQTSDILRVPALVGWRAHADVREAATPNNTCVCATSYDHIHLDVSPPRVKALYKDYPQTTTIITPAGVPGVPTPVRVHALMQEWEGPKGLMTGHLSDLRPGQAYVAAPIFVMHRPGEGYDPLALAACRFSITEQLQGRLTFDVQLEQIAVSPNHRSRGLGHLIALEASRWLGMLARSITINDEREHRIAQRVHATPTDAQTYQIAQAFYSNYCYFGITDELLDNTRHERTNGAARPGSVRSGLGTIEGASAFEDMIHIPDSALDLHGVDDFDIEVVI